MQGDSTSYNTCCKKAYVISISNTGLFWQVLISMSIYARKRRFHKLGNNNTKWYGLNIMMETRLLKSNQYHQTMLMMFVHLEIIFYVAFYYLLFVQVIW